MRESLGCYTAKGLLGLSRLATCLALVSCATTNLAPFGAAGTAPQTEKDEEQLWQTAGQLEQRIDNSGARYKDPELDAYLTAIAKKLLPPDAQVPGDGPRVKVIQNPLLNAFALPNGAIYVHTGILARMDNEAQLSALLGHELIHFTHRHAVKQTRGAQNEITFVRIIQIMLPGMEGVTGPLGSLWTLTSTSGYSRELETEADEQGLRAMVAAGYDPKHAPVLIEHLRQDLGEKKVEERFFFGTHPRLDERMNNFRRLLDTQYAAQARDVARITNAENFLGRTDQLLLDNAVLDINLGRLKTARVAIEKHLKRHPRTARAHFLMGEVHRRTGPEELHVQSAIAAYQEAARHDPTYAGPRRELGFLYRARGANDQARIEFEQYLILSPQATDALIVQGYLKELEKP
ncbi:MAG: M48 family metalloprotease [Betaproteobacteria bacterium]